jgi:hypothetical protein
MQKTLVVNEAKPREENGGGGRGFGGGRSNNRKEFGSRF